MSSFAASNTTTTRTNTNIRIERVEKPKYDDEQKDKTKIVWAKSKSFAHDKLWFEYVLPGLLESEGIKTHKMEIPDMLKAISDIWDAKQYEVNGQVSVVMNFTHEDALTKDYTGEHPTRWNKDTEARDRVILNALATIGSNDFRYYVMNGDEWTSPRIPSDCFFGTYPVKYKGNIQKGKFRCIIKQKRTD